MPRSSLQAESEQKSFEELLGEATENAAMCSSKSWARFCDFLRGWEQDAYGDMLGNQSRDKAWDFQQRWMQREALIRGAIAWADDAVRTRDKMLEELKEELENA